MNKIMVTRENINKMPALRGSVRGTGFLKAKNI